MCIEKIALSVGLATLLCFSAAGCGALEELDKSAALLETKGNKKGEIPIENVNYGRKRQGLDWSEAKSVTNGEIDSRIIQCTIQGEVTFTHSDDCLAQGGTAKRI